MPLSCKYCNTFITSTNSPSVTPPNTSVTPGAPVLAQFTDQAWYRAVVQEPVGAGAKVLFIYLISELLLQWKNKKMYSYFFTLSPRPNNFRCSLLTMVTVRPALSYVL